MSWEVYFFIELLHIRVCPSQLGLGMGGIQGDHCGGSEGLQGDHGLGEAGLQLGYRHRQ